MRTINLAQSQINMLKISVILIGKTRESWIQQAEQEYLKRLSSFAQIKIYSLKAQTQLDNLTNIKIKEGELISESILDKTYLIILDEKGKQFTSINFAQKINQIITQGNSHLTFVIGGTFGLDQRVKQKANLILSFSEFTFTHEMIRPLLLEQLYRTFTIIQNKTYHY